ncbi:MAG: flagellar hook-associated protein FlgK [Burkholderiales bacterium]
MATNIFGIGVSGLQAAQAGILTTGHNISNAATPGYSRQQVLLAPAQPQMTGDGFFGSGVDIVSVRRIYSDFLGQEVQAATAQSGSLDAYYAQMQRLDNMMADPASGLSPALQDFFSAIQNVATYPNSNPSRQTLLSSAATLSSRFAMIDDRLAQMQDGVNQDIVANTREISGYAHQVAELNQRITVALGTSGGQPPNDLMDQRDRIVELMNQDVRTTVLVQDDGAYNIFIGSGQPLVAGSQAFALETMRDPQDTSRLTVAYRTPAGQIQLPENVLAGGRLGGLLAFRSETLDTVGNAMGRLAIVLSETFNAQHALGQDLNGAPGTDFFAVGGPQISASTRNTGSATIAAVVDPASLGSLTTSNYRLDYDGTAYALTRIVDNTRQTFASLPQTVDGFMVSLASGAPAAGDTFLLRPTAAGGATFRSIITDPAQAAAAAPIRTARGNANIGTGVVSAGAVNALDPNLQQPVTFTFTSASTFDVVGTGTGNPVGVNYVPGQDISFNGWTIQLSGSPQTGDTFAVGPNTGGIGDNRNVLALGALQTRKFLDGGSASYQSAYSGLVGIVGTKTHELQVTSTAQTAVLEQARTAVQSFSGVNLDEEAANLMRYQQAYQASGKVLQIASTLFDTLLQLGN